jgi:hypothetical protein
MSDSISLLRLLVGRAKSLVRGENKAATSSRRRSLQLEELGSRLLPSATPLSVTGPVGPAPIVSPISIPPIIVASDALSGHGSGSYTELLVPTPVDTGPLYRLTGTAHLAGLGKVAVSGDLHEVGFIENGHAGGELTFTNKEGSLTVDLTGPQQKAFSPLPDRYSYQIVSGTGAYADRTGEGSLTLVLTPAHSGTSGHFSLVVGLPVFWFPASSPSQET